MLVSVPLVVAIVCHEGNDEHRHVVGDGIWARAQDLIRSASSIDYNHGG